MNQKDREKLAFKKAQLKQKQQQEERLVRLNTLLAESALGSIYTVKHEISQAQIIEDTWKYEPRIKAFKDYPLRSEQDYVAFISVLKGWIEEQNTATFLLDNEHLFNPNEWLCVAKRELVDNIKLFASRFRLFESILVAIDSQTFLCMVDCDNEVRLFKGKIEQEGKLVYHD